MFLLSAPCWHRGASDASRRGALSARLTVSLHAATGEHQMSVVKLVYFVVERAAEPLSARLESYAAQSERFRSACGLLANWYNNVEYRKAERHRIRAISTHAQGWEGLETEPPPPLSEQEATTLGCELLGECFVGGVALSILLAQAAQDNAEEAEQLKAMGALQSRLDNLQDMVHRNHALEQRLLSYETHERVSKGRSCAVASAVAAGETPAEAVSGAPPTWRRWLRRERRKERHKSLKWQVGQGPRHVRTEQEQETREHARHVSRVFTPHSYM